MNPNPVGTCAVTATVVRKGETVVIPLDVQNVLFKQGKIVFVAGALMTAKTVVPTGYQSCPMYADDGSLVGTIPTFITSDVVVRGGRMLYLHLPISITQMVLLPQDEQVPVW
jgi:hypothetical protein